VYVLVVPFYRGRHITADFIEKPTLMVAIIAGFVGKQTVVYPITIGFLGKPTVISLTSCTSMHAVAFM
jgi:hypothetical protein